MNFSKFQPYSKQDATQWDNTGSIKAALQIST